MIEGIFVTFELDQAKPHSIKKFEIISEYADAWARKILGYSKSEGIVYVDCIFISLDGFTITL